MNAADRAHEATHRAQEARREIARLAREASLKGSASAALAVRDAWEPIKLFQQELKRHDREREVPEGVVRND